jgi:hypothetical protein
LDLRGDSPGPPIAVQGGSFEFFLNGFAPASFELDSHVAFSLSPRATGRKLKA